MPNIHDQARASDGFGVVRTLATQTVVDRPTPEPFVVQPAEPIKRRPSGRVDFPSGVSLLPPDAVHDAGRDYPINVDGLGFITRGVAEGLAASLAGAVKALAEREARELARREREQS